MLGNARRTESRRRGWRGRKRPGHAPSRGHPSPPRQRAPMPR